MEIMIYLSMLVESGCLKKEFAEKCFDKLKYKSFPMDFKQTHGIIKSVFDQVKMIEKEEKANSVKMSLPKK